MTYVSAILFNFQSQQYKDDTGKLHILTCNFLQDYKGKAAPPPLFGDDEDDDDLDWLS